MFIPLNTKSDYSLGFGTSPPAELAEKAATLGYPAIGLADLDSLAGQVRFHIRCRSLGIRPITGLELWPESAQKGASDGLRGRIVLIARNTEGYRNLCRVIAARSERNLINRVADRAGGLFALSDDLKTIQALLSTRAFDKDHLGLLLIRPTRGAKPDGSAEKAINAAAHLGIPLVASLDTVFLAGEDHPLHLLQSAIRLKKKISDLTADEVSDPGRRLYSPAEAGALFADLPESIAAARRIADACIFDLDSLAAAHSPIDPLTGKSAEKRLAELCGRAIKERLRDGIWTSRHAERIQHEIALIGELGLSSCFLMIAAIVGYCRERGIPAAARGSAVSSLSLNLLGASAVDPVTEGLFFERFLHREKTAWPDVDLDLPSDRREEVIEWVYESFGRDRVAMLCAHNRFQLRSALREGLKAMGAKSASIRRVLDLLPPDDLQTEAVGLPQADLPPEVREMLPLVQRLVDRPRHLALHPGGILIGNDRLENLVPLQLASKGVVITQYDASDVAALGFFKLDLLGNRCLSELEETLRLAGNQASGRIEEIPTEDAETLDLIDRAETVGCFQLESPAMRSLLARLPVRNQSDIVTALALIRPGPASGKAKARYLSRPDKKALLFEEDVMALLSRVGGLSLAEADRLRSAIVETGGNPALLAKLRQGFLARSGPNGKEAWDSAEKFAAYSFNRAHAASYARLAYLSAYMKTHYPVEFTCALLDHHQGVYPLRTIAAEMRRRGIKILRPDINRSEFGSKPEFDIEKGVRVGFNRIKVLSDRTTRRILEARTSGGLFADVADLLGRVPIPGREITALVLSGTCDGLAPLAAGDYPFVHDAVLRILNGGASAGDLDLKAEGYQQECPQLYQGLARVMNELRYLEMHLSHHPMLLLRPEADRYGFLTIRETVLREDGECVRMAVLLAAMRRVPTEKGVVQFMTLEDETGLLEGIVLPGQYRQFGGIVRTPGPYLVEARVKHDHGAVSCEIVSVRPFYGRPAPYGIVNSEL